MGRRPFVKGSLPKGFIMKNIVIFGASGWKPGEDLYEQTRELGRAIAAAGWGVVTGGYGGAMEAASLGAHESGGAAVGILCGAWGKTGNPWLTERVETENLYGRLRGLVERGDAYVVMPGSTGTLVELTLVWELINKRLIPRRPLICFGETWRPVVDLMAGERTFPETPQSRERLGVAPLPANIGELILFADGVEAAMKILNEAL